MPGQALDTVVKTGTGRVIPGHNHIFTDIATKVVMTHIEAAPGHDTQIIATTPGLTHNTRLPHTAVTVIDPAVTHHTDPITDHPHTEVPHHTTQRLK